MSAILTAQPKSSSALPALSDEERLFFRDRLREARYAALADAEGFQQMCFAIAALGKRLRPSATGLGQCRNELQRLASQSSLLPGQEDASRAIKPFTALFVALKEARNDAMHTGAYARHVAADAVSLCLVLEDALVIDRKADVDVQRLTVGEFMVANPVVVHPWQTVEQARQLMLLNSFSYLPMWHQARWWLVSDIAMAQYLRPSWPARDLLKTTLSQASGPDGLKLVRVTPVRASDVVATLLAKTRPPGLWLVSRKGSPAGHLAGVLSPFELM